VSQPTWKVILVTQAKSETCTRTKKVRENANYSWLRR